MNIFWHSKVVHIFTTGILLSSVGLESSKASIQIPNDSKKADCRIEVDNAHISNSLFKHRLENWVKIDSKSICNVYQQRVTLTLSFYKKGALGDHLVGHTFMTNELARTSSGFIVEIKNAAVHCKDSRPTIYYGIAYAKALINGTWQYAGKTKSPREIILACGT
jgi:hypothetical protein